jgi:hypothetical protein
MLRAVGALTAGVAFAELPKAAATEPSGVFAKSRRGDGPDFVQLSADLGRNLMEGRLGILTAVFEASSART